MAKIDLEKLLCSWLNRTQYMHLITELNDALKEQGLEYRDGKIIEIETKPKFKVGDWIVWKDKYYKVNYNGCGYELIDQDGLSTSLEYRTIDESAHVWTIQDAKPGDVLDANGTPFIYKKHDKDYVYFFCGVNLAGEFIEANENDTWNNNSKVYPAAKEQRDKLERAMREAGYEWNEEKKELKKIGFSFSIADEKMGTAKDYETLETAFSTDEFDVEVKDGIIYLKKKNNENTN